MFQRRVGQSSSDGKYRLSGAQSAVILAGVALVVIVRVIAATSGSGGDPLAISRAMGSVVGTLVLVGVVAGLVYFLTRKRSLWPATITAGVLLVVAATLPAVGLPGIGSRTRAAAIWRDLDRANVRTLDELRSVAESPNVSSEYKSIMQRHGAELDRIGANLTGDDAVAVKVGAGFSRDITTIFGEYLIALQPFKKAGGLEPGTLKDKAAVTKRRMLLKSPLIMHNTILSSIRLIPQDLHNRIVKNGATERNTGRMEQAMLKGMQFDRLVRIQELENQLLTSMDEHLGALEASSSKWTSKGGIFEFRDQAALDAFNQRVQNLQATVAEQEKIQAELRIKR